MRIAFIGQKGIPAKSGGIETHVDFFARLAKLGHEIFVYTRQWYTDKNLAEYHVKLISLTTLKTKHFDAIAHRFSQFSAIFHNFDVIHYHGVGPLCARGFRGC